MTATTTDKQPYFILRAGSLPELERMICEKMGQGYRKDGPIFIMPNHDFCTGMFNVNSLHLGKIQPSN